MPDLTFPVLIKNLTPCNAAVVLYEPAPVIFCKTDTPVALFPSQATALFVPAFEASFITIINAVGLAVELSVALFITILASPPLAALA